jgi:transposase-like protein
MRRQTDSAPSENKTEIATGLPPREVRRWTPWRKRSVVLAVRDGVITMGEACEHYTLTHEELTGWIDAFERRGLAGLHLKCARRMWPNAGVNAAAD